MQSGTLSPQALYPPKTRALPISPADWKERPLQPLQRAPHAPQEVDIEQVEGREDLECGLLYSLV